MAGPIARRYKSGSIIYFEGDKGEEIYIVKSGRVVLTSNSVEAGEERTEELKPGEFFGVKSSLGHYPREETAQTLSDSVVLAMKLAEFDQLMSKNFRLVLKMLRVFSNQLRNLGKNVRKILGDSDLKKPSTELLKLAEYYYESSKLEYAKFGYRKFLEYFPNDRFGSRAKEMIQNIDSGQPYPGKFQQLYEEEYAEAGNLTIPSAGNLAMASAKTQEPTAELSNTGDDFGTELSSGSSSANNDLDSLMDTSSRGSGQKVESSDIDFPV